MSKKLVLVTGATGFIGSHTIVELLKDDYDIIGIDNLSNSSNIVVNRIKEITKKEFKFEQVDIRDEAALNGLFSQHKIDAVIHFAGYKAVGESVEKPLLYFSNNLKGTVTLLEVMDKNNVKSIVFSSSCTVYGHPKEVPVKENDSLSPENPYGRTKTWIDEILKDISNSDSQWSVISLRYFNPIGAHPSGLLGEDPKGAPNNLMPYIAQTAIGKREQLSVFGNDYNTLDGTCIRDYIHITDLANGHLKAVEKLENVINRIEYVNLGTGRGYSVLDIINTFVEVNKVDIPYNITSRRPGDAAVIYSDPSKAKRFLNWEAKKGLKEMVKDAWNFQLENPNGY